jgi:hypothetical protein
MPIEFSTSGDTSFGIGPMLGWTYRKSLPPIVVFGSPVQRAKEEDESYWHIPVTLRRRGRIGPGKLAHCRVFLDEYQQGRVVHKIQMAWGDAVFKSTAEYATLTTDEVLLVPIAFRTETGNDRSGYIASLKYTIHKDSERVLQNDRKKFRFKLRVLNGKKTIMSPRVYQLRIPKGKSNGQFCCEIEYEGEGTQP